MTEYPPETPVVVCRDDEYNGSHCYFVTTVDNMYDDDRWTYMKVWNGTDFVPITGVERRLVTNQTLYSNLSEQKGYFLSTEQFPDSEKGLFENSPYNQPTKEENENVDRIDSFNTMKAMGGLFNAEIEKIETGTYDEYGECHNDLKIKHPDHGVLKAIKEMSGLSGENALLSENSLYLKNLSNYSYVTLGIDKELLIWMDCHLNLKEIQAFWDSYWIDRDDQQQVRKETYYVAANLLNYAKILAEPLFVAPTDQMDILWISRSPLEESNNQKQFTYSGYLYKIILDQE